MDVVSGADKRKACRGERNTSSGKKRDRFLPFSCHAFVNHHHDRAEIADRKKASKKNRYFDAKLCFAQPSPAKFKRTINWPLYPQGLISTN